MYLHVLCTGSAWEPKVHYPGITKHANLFFSNVYIELLIAICMYVVCALGSPFLKLVAKVKSTYSKILEYVALKNV